MGSGPTAVFPAAYRARWAWHLSLKSSKRRRNTAVSGRLKLLFLDLFGACWSCSFCLNGSKPSNIAKNWFYLALLRTKVDKKSHCELALSWLDVASSVTSCHIAHHAKGWLEYEIWKKAFKTGFRATSMSHQILAWSLAVHSATSFRFSFTCDTASWVCARGFQPRGFFQSRRCVIGLMEVIKKPCKYLRALQIFVGQVISAWTWRKHNWAWHLDHFALQSVATRLTTNKQTNKQRYRNDSINLCECITKSLIYLDIASNICSYLKLIMMLPSSQLNYFPTLHKWSFITTTDALHFKQGPRRSYSSSRAL